MNRTAAIVVTAFALVAGALLLDSSDRGGVLPAEPIETRGKDHLALTPPKGSSVPSAVAKDGSLQLEAKLSGTHVDARGSEVLAQVELKALAPVQEVRHPVNLALVIDRSGSMCGRKFEDARSAAQHLVTLLEPKDQLAIVHYGSDTQEFPSRPVTEHNRSEMLAFLDAMPCEGGTNISGALHRASRLVAEVKEGYRSSRVILVSDGQPTEGATSAAALGFEAKQMAAEGIAVSAIGVGSDFDEVVMAGIAREGAGLFGYLHDSARMREIFAAELKQASGVAARSIVLEVRPKKGVELAEVYGHNTSVFPYASLSIADMRVGQTERVMAKLKVSGGEAKHVSELLEVTVRYRDALADKNLESSVKLAATFTEDVEQIAANLDEAVRNNGIRAEGARQMAVAAQAIREGKREYALDVFDNIRGLFGASTEALSGEASVLNDATRALQGGDYGHATKSLQSQSLKSFGQSSY